MGKSILMTIRELHPNLNIIKGFLLDMDGTLYLSDTPLPGSHDFVHYLLTEEIPFFCLTNNSSKSPRDYLEKFTRLGYQIDFDKILTSGQIAAAILSSRELGSSCYIVGTPSLEEEFLSSGFNLEFEHPEFVIVGFDTGLTYEKLSRLCTFVRQGIPYFATHPDFNCPTETGPIPDIGATLAYVEASTGRRPDEIFGKPFPALIQVVLEKTGIPASELCMVGDRLYTDIAMGEHGMKTILVLSGESKREDLQSGKEQPDWIFENVGELLASLRVDRQSR
jgi:HAD superfamily hydrolase (TIGR01450 family)